MTPDPIEKKTGKRKLELYVPTTPYGNDGLMPLNGVCPAYPDDSTSCMSSSGDSLCGGFMGRAVEEKKGVVYVLCDYGSLLTNNMPTTECDGGAS